MKWGHTWGGDIYRDGIHTEKGHTRRGDTHRHIKWG